MAYAIEVQPGDSVKLAKIDPAERHRLTKQQGQAAFHTLSAELLSLQEELYAAGQHGVLVVLQGMDTSGKDGTVRGVFRDISPEGCRVASFKEPTPEELRHDFLWRIHRQVPPRGVIGVFNRSHYEDVVTVKVQQSHPEQFWTRRYAAINEFERLLTDNDVVVLKFFLHISKEEQRERLLAREVDPTKAWKLSVDDWRKRADWDQHLEAYEQAIEACSTEYAPWYIVPADRKWFRNLAVCEALVRTLRGYRASWQETLKRMSEERLAELAASRSDGSIES